MPSLFLSVVSDKRTVIRNKWQPFHHRTLKIKNKSVGGLSPHPQLQLHVSIYCIFVVLLRDQLTPETDMSREINKRTNMLSLIHILNCDKKKISWCACFIISSSHFCMCTFFCAQGQNISRHTLKNEAKTWRGKQNNSSAVLQSTANIFVKLSVSFCLQLWSSFTDNIKIQYLQFMAYMKTPQYRSNLQQLLDQEKVIIVSTDCIVRSSSPR